MNEIIAPYPTGYYSQQCQCTRAEMDRFISQNAQLAVNASLVQMMSGAAAYVPSAARRHTGNCKHCGAPVNPHEEKCDYCDCYY